MRAGGARKNPNLSNIRQSSTGFTNLHEIYKPPTNIFLKHTQNKIAPKCNLSSNQGIPVLKAT
jgi:hypothetical protein